MIWPDVFLRDVLRRADFRDCDWIGLTWQPQAGVVTVRRSRI
jgi:hypothetical protein